MFFPIFTTILIVFGLFSVYMKTSNKKIQNSGEDLWKRELEANRVRRRPLDDLNMVKLDLSALPIDEDTDDEEIRDYQDKLKVLEKKEISNLSDYTNTDLKFKYGPANLEKLTELDQNFMELVRVLYQWAHYMYEKGEKEKCIRILEYGVSIHTDVKAHYKLLADIYAADFDFEAIKRITEEAKKTESPTRDSIVEMLESTDYFRPQEVHL
ncbi:MAG: hypothetical protein K5886_04180 [Lachnospiraceae bacterium]|nr:hypothetical protein [Lachnospiraceae bacterium]